MRGGIGVTSKGERGSPSFFSYVGWGYGKLSNICAIVRADSRHLSVDSWFEKGNELSDSHVVSGIDEEEEVDFSVAAGEKVN